MAVKLFEKIKRKEKIDATEQIASTATWHHHLPLYKIAELEEIRIAAYTKNLCVTVFLRFSKNNQAKYAGGVPSNQWAKSGQIKEQSNWRLEKLANWIIK